MSDFNDFYTQQLNEYGVLDSLKSNWDHKTGAKWTKVKAKLGSETAMGELDLRNEVKKIYDSFKLYCGQQKIDMRNELRAEDYVDFLINQVQFNIEDPVMFIYRKATDPQTQQAIEGIKSVSDSDYTEEMGTAVSQLLGAAQNGDATARYGLWELIRGFPTIDKVVKDKKFSHLVGKKLPKDQLLDMIERTAKVRLKRMTMKSGSGGKTGGRATGPAPEQPQMSTDANGNIQWEASQGDVQTVESDGGNKGWKHEAFDDEGIFAKAGLKNLKIMAQTLYGYAVDNKVQDFANAEAHLKSLLQPPQKAYQVARMLLEFYAPREMQRSLEAICATVSKDGQDISNDLRAIVEMMRRGTYNSDTVIRQLQAMFPNNTVSKLIIEALMGLSLKYDMGGSAAGPGAP